MEELLEFLSSSGITVKAKNGSLEITDPQKKITQQVVELIRSNKTELLNLFKGFNDKSEENVILLQEEKDYYPLSAVQKRLYFLYELDRTSTAYNVTQYYKLYGDLSIENVKDVVSKIIERHENLRTSFITIGDETKQRIQKHVDFDIDYYKLQEGQDIDTLLNVIQEPFNLQNGPLLKFGLVKIKKDQYILMVDMHHIITDGVSSAIIVNDFIKFYNDENLPLVKVRYKDYTNWQNQKMKQAQIRRQKDWWLESLKGDIPTLKLPTDFARPQIMTYEGEMLNFDLPIDISQKLKDFASEENTTLFTVLLSIFNILLSKIGNTDDIIIGTPVAGRRHVDLQKTLGLFINTLALRNFPKSDLSYSTFLSSVKTNALNAFDNQDFQFEDLINNLKIARDTSRQPLFDVMIVMSDFEGNQLNIPDLIIEPIEFDNHKTKFDLLFDCYSSDQQLSFVFQYYKPIFKRETIERFIKYFKNIIHSVLSNKNIKLSEIEFLSKEEKNQLLYEFNNTRCDYPENDTIIDLYEKQVNKTPKNTALIYQGYKLTYSEFSQKVNKAANYLVAHGVKRGDVIGIISDRSFELMVGIYSILKVGGVYLPIDAGYPASRISYIADNSQVKLILCRDKYKSLIPDKVSYLLLENDIIETYPRDFNDSLCTPKDLMYIIYTSGSTGNPKGVMIEHGSIVNRILWMHKFYPVGDKDVFIQKTTYVFDVSVWELVWWSISGASLFLLNSGDEKNPELIIESIKENNVSVIHFVPSMLNAFIEVLENNKQIEKLRSLKYVFSSGEALSRNLVSRFNKILLRSNKTKLINLYGPTEASIDVTWFNCFTQESYELIPIGKPIDNTKLYIVDTNNMLLPIGVAGELCIAGVGLARGYINNEKLSDEKFVACPFEPGTKMYKTGDLARWLPDGNIEYIERIDNQVKIRGFRIELGEIEYIASQFQNIKEAIATIKEKDNDKFIVVYYTSEVEIEESEIREFLLQNLPDYMVPAYFIPLSKIPYTSSGKIDKKALPDPSIKKGVDYEAPSSEIEKKLVEIWSEILKTTKDLISINKSFFELGGHSILAIKLTNQIKNSFGIELGILQFFNDSTIKGLAKTIRNNYKKSSNLPEIIVDKEKWYQPFQLSDIQQAYWIGRKDIFQYGNIGTHVYTELYIKDLNINRLKKVLQALIGRHGMLRMTINEDGRQQILEEVPTYEVKILDLRTKSEIEGEKLFYETRNEMSHQVFSGEEWPIFDIRITIFKDNTYKVHYSMDALVMDAGSLSIYSEEFMKLYFDPDVKLPINNITFRDYIISQDKLRENELYIKSKNYWLDRIKDIPLAPDLPINVVNQNENKPTFEQRRTRLTLSEWDKLQKKSKELEITPTVLLIACFSEVLNKWSKSSHFTLNLTYFNRIPFHSDVENIIGDFTSLTLLEIDFREKNTFIGRTKNLQKRMWTDLENFYFSGIEVLREMSRIRSNTVIMPVVVTSTLGLKAINIDKFFEMIPADINDKKKQEYSISQTPQVWIDVQIGEDDQGLWCSWDCIEGIFPKGMLDDLFNSFDYLLKSLVKENDIWNSNSVIQLPENQSNKRSGINSTAQKVPNKLLHELFYEKAMENEDAIAIETREKVITYGELNQISNTIGKNLRDLGAATNMLVGIVMDKCWEQIAASMGILYSGAAYLPIDAELPQDRINLLLKQGEVEIILTTSAVAERLKFPENLKIIVVKEELLMYESGQIKFIQNTKDLAYVIFTSGSTGVPKGVIIDHKGVVNTILDINSRFNISENDKIFALSSLSFDLSVYDIFGLLAAGGTIVIPENNEIRNPEDWKYYLNHHGVTVWNSVPALMQMLTEYTEQCNENLQNIRLVLMSGDWIPINLPERIRHLAKEIDLISLGGATEASIWSIWYRIEEIDPKWNSIPYGKPLINQYFKVLMPDLSQCPDYVPGDLYIGGIGLAQGYWRDKNKTQKSFIVHPETNERLYKTGDIGRYFPDGNIEFMGREDSQVKINGYRIELGEIETILKLSPVVNEALVVASGEKNELKELIAYIIPEKEYVSQNLVQDKNEDSIGELANSENTITDKYERTLFKLKKHGTRIIDNSKIKIQLLKSEDNDLKLTSKAAITRYFENRTLSFNEFSNVFTCLSSLDTQGQPLPKYYYPSAGSLYPVQAYIFVRPDKIEKVKAGFYYYNSQEHSLELICPYVAASGNQLISVSKELQQFSFTIHLIANLNAIHPLYGKFAEMFCYQEAGYMTNLLINTYNRNTVFSNKVSVDPDLLCEFFLLDSNYIHLQSLAIGAIKDVNYNTPDSSIKTDFEQNEINEDFAMQLGYLERKSYRVFKEKQLIKQNEIKIILSKLNSNGLLESYNQKILNSFLYVKENQIEGLKEGIYNIDLQNNSLKFKHSNLDGKIIFEGNEFIYESSGFAIILTGQKEHSGIRNQVLFHTGYLGQNMMNISTKHNIGFCAIGTVNQRYSSEILKLSEDEEVLHSFLGGRVTKDQIENLEQIDVKDQLNADREQLKDLLKNHLPSYMIPHHYIPLESFPLNNNGKIDYKALPEPNFKKDENIIAPLNENEEKIAELWAEELNLKKEFISTNKSFFELGGNSINAIKILNSIKKEMNFDIKLKNFYDDPTIKGISELIAIIDFHLEKNNNNQKYEEIVL